ncbi:MAG TPA: hypothetical protein VLF62_01735 [Candidatus Saccharimonadales bacterium]|nr:hypothetical protein [Candidatus Saccharimonadales bacterium]
MAAGGYDDEDGDSANSGGVTPGQRAARRAELERELGERRIDASGNDLMPPGGAASAESLGNAEKQDPVGGLYKAAGVDPDGAGEGGNKLSRRLKGISRRKKILSGAGIGGVTALIMSAALVTPIYRIPALMNDLESKMGKEVDDIVEARAERMIVNYLVARAGGLSTNYVITGSPLESLWRTFQSRKIEEKIFKRTGIRFIKVNDVVHVIHDGRDLGKVKNYEEIQKIIDRGTIKTKKDFKIIVKSVVPAARFHKASIEASSFKNRFLKGRGYSVPKVEDDPAKTAAQNAAKEVEELTAQQIDDATGKVLDHFDNAIECVLDGAEDACNDFKDADTENPAPDPNSEEAQRNISNGSSEEVSKDLHEGKDEAKKEAVKDRKGGFMNRMIEAILKKVVGAAAAKTITAAIPYIGWIDLAATLQHAFGDALKNHLAERIPIAMRQSAYGAIYSSWEGYAHNTKAGKVPLPMLSALSSQLGDAGKSQGHHVLYDNNDRGEPVSPKVGDDKDYKLFDIMDEVYNNFGVRFVIRGPLELWYYTVGKLFKLVGDLGADVVSWLMKVTGFTALMDSTLKAVFGDNWKEEFGKFAVKAIMWLFGIAIDPLAKGAAMFNNLFAGAAVALNYHCHYVLGCRVLTSLQEKLIFRQLDQKDQEEMAMTPLRDRLFSPDMPKSLTATLLRNSPTSAGPGAFMASLFKQVGALPNSVMRAFSPNVRAADYTMYSKAAGVRWYGALPTDLDQDTAAQVRQQKAGEVKCPEVSPTQDFNACAADTTVVNALQCAVDPGNCPQWKPAQ